MIHVTDISNLLRKLVLLQLKKAATRNGAEKCSKMVWRPGDPALPRPLTGFKRGEGAREGRG